MSDTETLLFNISSFVAGLFLLQYGAEKFMDHTAVVAKRINVSPLLIGLLTCGAEWEGLVVIAVAMSQKNPDLAIGSVFGASIANILSSFSLGLLVGMKNVEFDRSSKLYSVVLVAVTSMFLVLMVLFRSGPKWLAGWLLLAAFAIYVASVVFFVYWGPSARPERDPVSDSDSDTCHESDDDVNYSNNKAHIDDEDEDDDFDLTRHSRDEQSHQLLPLSKPSNPNNNKHARNQSISSIKTTTSLPPTKPPPPQKSIPHHLLHLTLGLAALLISSYIIAHSAATIGHALSLSGTVVGTTILSLATTLPDKFVAVLGGVRQQPGILVANAVGSNIFLATLCGGLLFLCMGDGEDIRVEEMVFEMGVMWAGAVSVLAVVLLGGTRWAGGLLMAGYGAFLVVEVMRGRESH